MKSETLIKIKENRKKYFLEVQQLETEKNSELNFEKVKYNKPEELKFKINLPDLSQVLIKINSSKWLKKKLVNISVGFNQVLKLLKNLYEPFGLFLLKRSDKIRARIFSFMMVLFDAKI